MFKDDLHLLTWIVLSPNLPLLLTCSARWRGPRKATPAVLTSGFPFWVRRAGGGRVIPHPWVAHIWTHLSPWNSLVHVDSGWLGQSQVETRKENRYTEQESGCWVTALIASVVATARAARVCICGHRFKWECKGLLKLYFLSYLFPFLLLIERFCLDLFFTLLRLILFERLHYRKKERQGDLSSCGSLPSWPQWG